MIRRQGTTLTEVLVAIFVMGIGAMAVLAMFPLAAVSMARSIKDDRIGHAAANAKSIAVAKSIRQDGSIDSGTANRWFDNPTGNPATGPAAGFANAPLNGPSWPVYVDPVGIVTIPAGNPRNWVGGQAGGLRRRPLSFVTNPVNSATNGVTPTMAMLTYCTFLDELTFGSNGQPLNTSGGPLSPTTLAARSATVSYAWLLRRPMAGTKSICDLTVVIYSQRSLGTGALTGGQEIAYAIQVNGVQPNLITVLWNPAAGVLQPQIGEGGWILDITKGPKDAAGNQLPGNARFYRVVNIGDVRSVTVGATTFQAIDLELANSMPTSANTIAVVNNVVEVIECGDSWRSWNN
jgi:prepilin-type N-terminal cleavage/methylation domain-containing protein